MTAAMVAEMRIDGLRRRGTDAAQHGLIQVNELYDAIGGMRIALDKAHRALDESRHLVVFEEGGKVTRIVADHESDLSCIVINWDVQGVDTDHLPLNGMLVEVEWTETEGRDKVLINCEDIEVSPNLVRDVFRAYETSLGRAGDS